MTVTFPGLCSSACAQPLGAVSIHGASRHVSCFGREKCDAVCRLAQSFIDVLTLFYMYCSEFFSCGYVGSANTDKVSLATFHIINKLIHPRDDIFPVCWCINPGTYIFFLLDGCQAPIWLVDYNALFRQTCLPCTVGCACPVQLWKTVEGVVFLVHGGVGGWDKAIVFGNGDDSFLQWNQWCP